MNHVNMGGVALALTLALPAADFGTVPDPYTGNWTGTLMVNGREEPLHATVIAYRNRHEVALRAEPDPRKAAVVILNGTAQADHLVLAPTLSPPTSPRTAGPWIGAETGAAQWQGRVDSREITGTLTGRETGSFNLRKVPFTPSPTLGAQAPAGAEILFAGTHLDAWESRRSPGEPIQWVLTGSGAVEIVSANAGKRAKQDLKTKDSFRDYHLHLEFKLAHKPEATGQGRSNSGVIHLGLYETQILDSFGLHGRDNECGGIYRIREPDQNASYPAGLWQTYDIDFQAPRFSPEGAKTAAARMTVRLNGVLIHNNVSVPQPTAGGKETERGPIVLQDHGNPVQFRNIWLQRRNENE